MVRIGGARDDETRGVEERLYLATRVWNLGSASTRLEVDVVNRREEVVCEGGLSTKGEEALNLLGRGELSSLHANALVSGSHHATIAILRHPFPLMKEKVSAEEGVLR